MKVAYDRAHCPDHLMILTVTADPGNCVSLEWRSPSLLWTPNSRRTETFFPIAGLIQIGDAACLPDRPTGDQRQDAAGDAPAEPERAQSAAMLCSEDPGGLHEAVRRSASTAFWITQIGCRRTWYGFLDGLFAAGQVVANTTVQR